jgi:hypothetical protein
MAQPNALWTRQFGTVKNDDATAVESDSSGNLYVVGTVSGTLVRPVEGKSDVFLAKFDPCGTMQWARQLGTTAEDLVTDLVIDRLGSIWIVWNNAGWGGMKGEGFLTSFNTCGDQRGTWSVGEITGRTGRMRICRNNRFGILISSNRFDGSVLKSSITAFDAFGRRRWSKQYQFNDGAAIMDISSDRQGNTYIVRGHNTLTFYGVLSRLDTKGNHCWTRSFGARSIATTVTTDERGHIWVGGAHLSSEQWAKIAEFHPDGTMANSAILANSGMSTINSMVAKDGSAFATGSYRLSPVDDQYVAALDGHGAKWMLTLGTSGSGMLSGITLDPCGRLIVCGRARGNFNGQPPIGEGDAFLLQMDRP